MEPINNNPLTPSKINNRITKFIVLFVVISFIISLVLFIAEPFFFFFSPVVFGLVALVFMIKMIAEAVKFCKQDNESFIKLYIVGIFIIVGIEIALILFINHVAKGIRWL